VGVDDPLQQAMLKASLLPHLPGWPGAVKRAGGLGRPQRRAGLVNGSPVA